MDKYESVARVILDGPLAQGEAAVEKLAQVLREKFPEKPNVSMMLINEIIRETLETEGPPLLASINLICDAYGVQINEERNSEKTEF